MIRDNNDYYKKIDELVPTLRDEGHIELADKLIEAKSSGFMPTEILGATSLVLQELLQSEIEYTEIELAIEDLLAYVRKVL